MESDSKFVRTEPDAADGGGSPLAPDGLPWPPGYFDCAPKKSFDQALAEYGVRPNHYFKGWPVYTDEEAAKPEFKARLPEEPAELEQKWADEWRECYSTAPTWHKELLDHRARLVAEGKAKFCSFEARRNG